MADRPIPRIRPMVSQEDFNEATERIDANFNELFDRLTIIERALAANIEAVEQLTDILFATPEDDEVEQQVSDDAVQGEVEALREGGFLGDVRVDPDNPGNEVDLSEDDDEAARREAEQLRAEAKNEGLDY